MKRIIVVFPQDDGMLFDMKFEGPVHESQFDLAGRELIAIAQILREHRIGKQLQVKAIVKPSQPDGDGSGGSAVGPKE